MDAMTVRELAKLGRNRQLPTYMERQWELRTKINPVRQAIYYKENMRGKIRQLQVSGAFVVLSVLTVLFSRVEGPYASWNELLLAPNSLGSLMVGYLIVAACAVTWFLDTTTKMPGFCKHQAELFATDLTNFRDWQPMVIMAWIELDDNLEPFARAAIVATALEMLKVQETPEEKRDSEYNRTHAALETELALRYDTFVRLGLASGGFGSYYADAKRCIEKESLAIDGA